MQAFVRTLRRTAGLIIAISLASLTVFSQQQKRSSIPVTSSRSGPQGQSPTFETLLASDTYKIYVEVRGVGQLVGSPGVNDLVARSAMARRLVQVRIQKSGNRNTAHHQVIA